MLKIILQDPRFLAPFNDRARDLRVMNKPLWLSQRDVLTPYTDRELELPFGASLPKTNEECIVYRDNLYFDTEYIDEFLSRARETGRACRAAFRKDDPPFKEHALPLSVSYTQDGDLYLIDLWYYPRGPNEDARPLVIETDSIEAGYYHVPTYMAYEQGDLTFQVPMRACLAIDTWVHIFIADVVYGLFCRGARFEAHLDRDPLFKLRVLATAMYEGKQVLDCSDVVKIGRNCTIDPSAIIHGPTTIGDNVTVGAGVAIENCVIGDNVNVGQGCQLMLSVVGDGAFLPFRAALFMTTFMDNSMVAQNTCLQMCVIGRNTFIGAGSTFTDYNLLPSQIRALDGNGKLKVANRPVLGGCVGHNCRLGAGMIIFPARTIESDVVLFASDERRVVEKNVTFEESDHHKLNFSNLHPRLYPRPGEATDESWEPVDAFAFIIHPIDPKRDIGRKYPFLARIVNDWIIYQFSPLWPPVYLSEVQGVVSAASGKEIKGWLIACPLSPKHFFQLPEKRVYRKIIETGWLAEKLGAKILGLGAYTSVVGDAGKTIARALDIPVTTGDAYTVAVAVRAVEAAAGVMDLPLRNCTAAVVGATGAIGKACAALMGQRAGELLLVARREAELERVREELAAKGCQANLRVSTDMAALREAQLILTVTSAAHAVIEPAHLQPGSVVCDVARPRDVSVRVAAEREDVLVIDGGMVEVPGSVDFHFDFGFPPGKAYACMAETMALTLEGRFEDYTLGKDLDLEKIKEITNIADKHGFRLSGFRSFERAVTEEQIDRVRKNAQLGRRHS